MRQRTLPPTGGGEDVISAAGVLTPATNGDRQPLQIVLTRDTEAEARGREVIERVKRACNTDDLEGVAMLRFLFEQVTTRVPEFHALLGELGSRDPAAMKRLMRDPGSPGRPRSSLFIVALVDQVIEEQRVEDPSFSAKDAARWIEKHVERGEHVPYVPGVKRIENLYSDLRDLFRVWRRSLYARAELLTAEPWRVPGHVVAPPRLVMTRLSQSVVFHSPSDTVTEGASNVEERTCSSQQSLEPVESEQPGVPQQPSGKRRG